MKLLIVESPGKVKKIQEFLGADFQVMASVGHVRDLPTKETGVAPPDFKPKYVPTDRGKQVLAKLAAAAKNAETVYLATDPDREGEAIAWHLADALKLKGAKRVTYSEITERAVKAAIDQPRDVDMALVCAQEGRRVLDRLVGFKVSPEISRVAGGQLSAGRVQSPALRLVVDREAAIEAFKSTTHYGVELTFEALDNVTDGWKASWNSKDWLEDGQEYFLDQQVAERIAGLRNLTVAKYEESESRQAPPSPFTTSSLQQAASNTLKFSPKRTMELAQKLYESSHITYIRTDSPNLSEEAVNDIRDLASKNDWPVLPKPRVWKAKEGAQESHEAIRPTHIEIEEAGSNEDEKALYRLIRLRALASLLVDAIYAVTSATLEGEIDGRKVIFEARGRRLTSPGWRVLLSDDSSETEAEPLSNMPKLREGSQAVAVSGEVLTKKTRPQARFTEASLVNELEKLGIGRPSTYAAILENIASRGYVKLEKRQFVPTELGRTIIKTLSGRFAFLDFQFTRRLEEKLDEVAEGRADYLNVVREAFELLEKEAAAFIRETGHSCPDCGRALRHFVKQDAKGQRTCDLWNCTGYPECKASFANDNGKPGSRLERKSPTPPSDYKCPKCGRPLYRRQGLSKAGKKYDFFGCGDRSCNATYWTRDDKPDFEGAAKS